MVFAYGRDLDLEAFSKNHAKFLTWGIIMVVLGLLAICYSAASTLFSMLFLGILIFVSGIITLGDTFSFEYRKKSGFFLHLLLAVLYILVGIIMIARPVWASVSITLFLGVFYLVLGLSRIIYSFMIMGLPKWGWVLLSGVISFILGFLILYHWPISALFIIGLFVGIDLLFVGWAYILASIAGKKLKDAVKP